MAIVCSDQANASDGDSHAAESASVNAAEGAYARNDDAAHANDVAPLRQSP